MCVCSPSSAIATLHLTQTHHLHSYVCLSVVNVHVSMGWLRLVGSLQIYVSFAKEPYKRDCILQTRPMILRSQLIVATPYQYIVPVYYIHVSIYVTRTCIQFLVCFVYTYKHVYVYKRTYIYIHIHRTTLNPQPYVYTCIHIHVRTRINIHVHVLIHMYTHVYIYMYVYV